MALPMFLLVDKRFGPRRALQVPPTPAPLPHSAAGLEGLMLRRLLACLLVAWLR